MKPKEGIAEEFLEPSFLQKLEYLDIVAKKIFLGEMEAGKSGGKRGPGTQFHDYRNYSYGDDLRYLDWNIYGRLDELFIKEFEVEERIHLNLILDTSASMSFGSPPKIEVGKKLAAALGFIGLSNFDRVNLLAIPSRDEMVSFQGKKQVFPFFERLSSLRCAQEAHFFPSIRDAVTHLRSKGLVAILSDFYDPSGYQKVLRFLIYRRFQVFCLHLWDPLEVDPPFRGMAKLRDLETGRTRLLRITPSARLRYIESFQRFCRHLKGLCREEGIGYISIPTGVPFDFTLISLLRRGGLLR